MAEAPPQRPGIMPVRRHGDSVPRPAPDRSKDTRGDPPQPLSTACVRSGHWQHRAGNRDPSPYAASILNMTQVKRDRFPAMRSRCRKVLIPQWFADTANTPKPTVWPEIGRKRSFPPVGELRPFSEHYNDKGDFHLEKQNNYLGIYQALVAQLDKLARHNRQGKLPHQRPLLPGYEAVLSLSGRGVPPPEAKQYQR